MWRRAGGGMVRADMGETRTHCLEDRVHEAGVAVVEEARGHQRRLIARPPLVRRQRLGFRHGCSGRTGSITLATPRWGVTRSTHAPVSSTASRSPPPSPP